MEMQRRSIAFGSVAGSGPQNASAAATFSTAVTQATAILTGFVVEYSDNNDHHLGQLNIDVSVPPGAINGAVVNVAITFGLRFVLDMAASLRW